MREKKNPEINTSLDFTHSWVDITNVLPLMKPLVWLGIHGKTGDSILRFVATLCKQYYYLLYKPVQMGDGDNFTSNIVIETVNSIGVDKTVSNPDTSLHTIFYFTTNLE